MSLYWVWILLVGMAGKFPRTEGKYRNYTQEARFTVATLSSRRLIAAVSEHPPHIYTEHDEDDHLTVKLRGGSHIRALEAAARAFNFTFTTVDTGFNDWNYGTYFPENGTWTGMVKKILGPNPEADFMLQCPFDYQFNFLPKAWPMSTSDLIFFTKPGMQFLNWYSIFRTFDAIVWTLFFLQMLVIGLMQALLGYILVDGRRPEIFNAAIFKPLGLALEQQDPNPSKRHSARLTSLLLVYGSLIMGAAYRGDLRQQLLFPTTEPRPQTFEQLVDHMPDFSIRLTIMGGIEKRLFENPQSKLLRNLKSRLIYDVSWFPCFSDAFGSEKTVCIVWSAIVDEGSWGVDQSKKLFDPFYQSKNAVYSVYNSWAFPPGSELVQPLKWVTSALYEAGFFSRWEREVVVIFKQKQRELFQMINEDMYSMLEVNLMQPVTVNKQLKLENVWIMFAMMGVFLGTACLVFGVELALHRFSIRKKTQVLKFMY